MQTLTLLHPETFPIGRYVDALTKESISSSRLESLDQLLTADATSLRVVLVDPGIINGRFTSLHLDARTAVVGLGLREQPRWLDEDSVYIDVPQDPTPAVLLSAIRRAYQII